LKKFKQAQPDVSTKSGLMLGLGEELDEVIEVMRDMRNHDVEMLTLGQYLQPSEHHLAVERFVTPDEFDALYRTAMEMGFKHVASGPMVRSSYHADLQAHGEF
jgi:lipoic acid synthetase